MLIVNYNGVQHLPACLDALDAQSLEGGHELVVVDNGSTDGSREYLHRRPDVRVLELNRNLGFAGGNNVAIAEAKGRYLVLLNADTRVRAGWLEALVAAAEADPRLGAVTSKLLYEHRPGVIQNAGLLLLSDGAAADRGSGRPDGPPFLAPQEVFGFCGAACLLRREMLADTGAFDETFFMYYEDTDLSWRLRLRGWRVRYEPAAVVDHEHAAFSSEGSRFFRFHADRNRLFLLVKNARAGLLVRGLAALGGRTLRREPRSGRSTSAAAGTPYAAILASFARHLPEMLVKRRQVRGRRLVGDAEIEAMMVAREEWKRGFG